MSDNSRSATPILVAAMRRNDDGAPSFSGVFLVPRIDIRFDLFRLISFVGSCGQMVAFDIDLTALTSFSSCARRSWQSASSTNVGPRLIHIVVIMLQRGSCRMVAYACLLVRSPMIIDPALNLSSTSLPSYVDPINCSHGRSQAKKTGSDSPPGANVSPPHAGGRAHVVCDPWRPIQMSGLLALDVVNRRPWRATAEN